MRQSSVGSRLFLTYTAVSVLPILGIAALLVQGATRDSVSTGLQQGKAQAAVIQQMAIGPALRDGDLERAEAGGALSDTELGRLRGSTQLAVFNASVLHLRVRNESGTVLFSDDGSPTSPVPADDPDFRAAAEGETVASLVTDGSGEKVVRVTQPIIVSTAGRSSGVLEVELPYAPIQAELDARLRETYQRLGGGLAVLYVVLGAISWSATRRLRQHAATREHEATHDQLTGLPNRALLRERVERMLPRGGALALVDLDKFKNVNDTLGHHAGDTLLQVVAQRLLSSLRTDDTVARIGGDEFALVLPGVTTTEEALTLLRRVEAELAQDIDLGGTFVRVEGSIGVAFSPHHGTGFADLLRHADAAMYQGKRGTSSVVVYAPDEVEQATGHVVLQRELGAALEDDQFVLHYQPQVDLRTGAIDMVEALVRWQHPVRGLLSPAEFLTTIERSHLIDPFTRWVLARAMGDCARWHADGLDVAVAVNVSPRNLTAGLVDVVAGQLAASGVRPGAVTIEVTENAFGTDTPEAQVTLTSLSALGLKIALDDFGTGYTSLSQLRRIPFDQIKVDRSFIAGICSDAPETDRTVVAAVVGMAHGLGCTVVAEGVEDEATADWLRDVGCDIAQGYHFARPAPWQQVAAMPSLVRRRDGEAQDATGSGLPRQPVTHEPREREARR